MQFFIQVTLSIPNANRERTPHLQVTRLPAVDINDAISVRDHINDAGQFGSRTAEAVIAIPASRGFVYIDVDRIHHLATDLDNAIYALANPNK